MVNPDSPKVNFNPSDEGNSSQSDQDVKPIEAPRSTQDFRKVFNRSGREGKENKNTLGKKKTVAPKVFSQEESWDVETDKDDEEQTAQGAVSLFDLSKGAKPKEELQGLKGAPQGAGAKTKKSESPSDLFKRMNSKEMADAAAVKDKEAQNKYNSRYAQEQPDLAYVNPFGATTQAQEAASVRSSKVEPTPVVGVTSLQEIVNELVKHLYTVEKKGQTDTVLVLQYPPAFKDAKIIVSSFDTAKGQLNIAFENLTQEAQHLINLDANRQSLIEALHKYGYNVQNMFATTITTENMNPTIEEDKSRQGQQDQDENQQQHPKKR